VDVGWWYSEFLFLDGFGLGFGTALVHHEEFAVVVRLEDGYFGSIDGGFLFGGAVVGGGGDVLLGGG